MINDILSYIVSYDAVRALTGLNSQELPDTTLALDMYRHQLGLALNSIQGPYTPSEEDETLQEIFERTPTELPSDDPMYALIQLFSTYVVSDMVMTTIGLRAYKAMADGKSSLTRFSPVSAYLDSKTSIKNGMSGVVTEINDLLGIAATDASLLVLASPDIDLVTGE